MLNRHFFVKVINALLTEVKLIFRSKITTVCILCALLINCFQCFYIMPADWVIGNSIALSSWITQLYLIMGITFGIAISEKEIKEIQELLISLKMEMIKRVCKVIALILHALVLYGICVLCITLSLKLQGASVSFILSSFQYILIYWIFPFIVAGLLGLLIAHLASGKMKYVLALIVIILSGSMLPALLEPLIEPRTSIYKYISVCNIGPLHASKPLHLMFGYSTPFEKKVIVLLLVMAYIILFLCGAALRKISKCTGMTVGIVIVICSYMLNYKYISENYDCEMAMGMYETYSAGSKISRNDNYEIVSMDIEIDERIHSFDYDVAFELENNQDVSYITFMLYHGFEVEQIKVDGIETDFTRDKDLVEIHGLFQEGDQHKVEVKYCGRPAIHMYSDYNNWLLASYFAWYPMHGNSQNIVCGEDLFEVDFLAEEHNASIPFHVTYHGNTVLYCNLDKIGDNEWTGESQGVTMLDSDLMHVETIGDSTYVYPMLCRNYNDHMEDYANRIQEYQRILEMPIEENPSYLFVCDTTYTGHGGEIRTIGNELYIEITRGYVDGSQLQEPLIGIYALIRDKYLRNVERGDLEYLYECSYVVSMAKQGKISEDIILEDLNDRYEAYSEIEGYEDLADLILEIDTFLSNSTIDQQKVFFDTWSAMLNEQDYSLDGIRQLLGKVEHD